MSLQRLLAYGKPNIEKSEDDAYKKEDFTFHISRRIATPITNLIYPINVITPNRITWVGFIIVLIGAGILFIAENNIFLLFLVGFCYWISAILDCVDGQLARMRENSSKIGSWLDSALEDGKAIPLFLALGFHIQDSDGFFTLQLDSTSIITLDVWFTLFVMYSLLGWLSMMAIRGNILLNEPEGISHSHVYIFWIILILNLLDWFLALYTFLVFLAVLYTLFEKTFLHSRTDTAEIKS